MTYPQKQMGLWSAGISTLLLGCSTALLCQKHPAATHPKPSCAHDTHMGLPAQKHTITECTMEMDPLLPVPLIYTVN